MNFSFYFFYFLHINVLHAEVYLTLMLICFLRARETAFIICRNLINAFKCINTKLKFLGVSFLLNAEHIEEMNI